VVSALQNLGYRPAEAAGAVELALEKLGGEPGGFERLLKEALREISRR
jgi:Holliday junction resolvasome RuvABC DNA-binding subunit